ncbi:DUF362 domain-containing protein [Desulfovibrio litoralis]|uniref:4Fe-4S ferredoxin-type domain-containing protein n=1 Tax=Desulfovibrio litoralis DSM 11393 TaxID=1121455 RepID=A0A1M7T8X2_9BACT|nr:DUF362 domain-containing protein [Desulfovibrio litoralis]SHN67185.1 hypothetical protein SAMN02745728_01744 [Desulfovibrio litoralis DSM 11393]
MKSKVYFSDARSRDFKESKINKIKKLLKKIGLKNIIEKDALTAVKVHFGERGNDTFMNPVFVRSIVDEIKSLGGKPFVTDTNTLYKGSRHNAVDHLMTALEHGFGFATINAPIIIADGLKGGNFIECPIKGKHFKKVKIAEAIHAANAMVVLSHFKGHQLAGFGGAIKNLAMGCAPGQGKKEQHASRFHTKIENCTACGMCIAHCPEDAISFVHKEILNPKAIVTKKENEKPKASINKDKCIGCGECLTVCKYDAIAIDFGTEMIPFNERMAEYAYGVTRDKSTKDNETKIIYINLLLNITPDCDCASWSDAPMVPDLGIMASLDPVALDKACFDMVNAQQGISHSHLQKNYAPGEDKFKGVWDYTVGEIQLSYAEKLGMGSLEYEIVKI